MSSSMASQLDTVSEPELFAIASDSGMPTSEPSVSGASSVRMSAAVLEGQPIPGANEFDYRPVPVIAPVALFLALSSVIGHFTVAGLIVGLCGLLLGVLAVRQIRRSSGELGGLWIARLAASLSLIFLFSGTAVHAHAYATELPEGYDRVNFTRDIAKKGFIVENGETLIHPEVRELDGKAIFLKGYMYPERQSTGLTQFVLVKDNLQCCFGGQPALTDMILVEMTGNHKVDYTTSLVSVAGTFQARSPQQAGSLMTIYKMSAPFFTAAKTSY